LLFSLYFLRDYFLTGATTVLTVSFLDTAGLVDLTAGLVALDLVDFLTAGLVALTAGLETVSFLATVVAGLATVPVVALLVVCALTANTVRATVRVINSFFIFLSVLFFFLCNTMLQNRNYTFSNYKSLYIIYEIFIDQ